MKVGFVGLGNMGEPIALNLLKAGHELTVYNRTRSRASTLEAAGAKVADAAASTCSGDFVFSMLSDDNAVKSVTDEMIKSMTPDVIHISLSTISVQLSRSLNQQHLKAGRKFIAAPVFGRPAAARAAQLLMVAAGEPASIDKCMPLLASISRKVIVVGNETEKANLIKLSGNFMIATILEGMAESCALIRKSGMHQREFLQIICDELFPSPVIKPYGEVMSEDRFVPAGFAMELGLKDLRLLLAAADESAVPMPVASLLKDNFLSGIARGKGQSDWSALAEIANENAGVTKLEPAPKCCQ